MRLATPAQCRQIDADSLSFGVSAEVLMEAAGSLAADRIARFPGPVLIACGPGHNGADGLVIARHLLARGRRDVRVHLISPGKSELFALQMGRLRRLGLVPGELNLRGAAVVVDAIFGVGFRGDLSDAAATLVDRVNRSSARRISIDIPSGLDALTGTTARAIRAHETLTFGLAKPGFFINAGPAHCGRVRVLQPGFPRELYTRAATTHSLFTARDARLPTRPSGANKTHFGHALILAGSAGTWGAGLLAADAAFRAGAGYVTWASFDEPDLRRIPEMMTARADDSAVWSRATALAIGPGLGTGEATREVLERARAAGLPAVIDADALTVIAKFGLAPLPANWILTPHAGEMSRLIGVPAAEIERDRFAAVARATELTGAVVLLKGFRTVVGEASRARVIHAGNAALAKAGTGDVLAGMIAGLLARGLSAFDAAATGAYLHGRVADEWIKTNDAASLRAGDVIEALPRVMAQVNA